MGDDLLPDLCPLAHMAGFPSFWIFGDAFFVFDNLEEASGNMLNGHEEKAYAIARRGILFQQIKRVEIHKFYCWMGHNS